MMDPLTYFPSAALAFFGFFLGYSLLRIASAEQKPLEDSLRAIQLISSMGILVGAWSVPLGFFLKIGIIALLFALLVALWIDTSYLYSKKIITKTNKPLLLSLLFGISFALSSNAPFHFALAFLCFLFYSIATAALAQKKTDVLAVALRHTAFFAAATLGYFFA